MKARIFKKSSHPFLKTIALFIVGALALKLIADSQSRVDY